MRAIQDGISYTTTLKRAAARRGTSIADSDEVDMEPWLDAERLRAVEMLDSAFGLSQKQASPEWHDVSGLIRYTLAHHFLAEQNYAEALRAFASISRKDFCRTLTTDDFELQFGCVPEDVVRQDIQRTVVLREFATDSSALGRYHFGIAVYEDELTFYNPIVGNGRRDWRRPPARYFEKRNNFFVASLLFQSVLADSAAPLELRQQAGYKLARCYEHLARPSSFFFDALGGRTRPSFALASAKTFEDAARIRPQGVLADDSLTEAAVHYYTLLGNSQKALALLGEVRSSYGGRAARKVIHSPLGK